MEFLLNPIFCDETLHIFLLKMTNTCSPITHEWNALALKNLAKMCSFKLSTIPYTFWNRNLLLNASELWKPRIVRINFLKFIALCFWKLAKAQNVLLCACVRYWPDRRVSVWVCHLLFSCFTQNMVDSLLDVLWFIALCLGKLAKTQNMVDSL